MSIKLSHYTILTRDLRMAPRSEVDDHAIEMLKPIVRAGLGMVAGPAILLESHQVHNDTEAWVFTLAYKHETPRVRCWLSRTANPDLWQFGGPEPPAPWLAVALLDEAANLTAEQAFMLGDAELRVAWAFLEL